MFNNHTMSVITNLNMLGNNVFNSNDVIIAAITTSDYPNYENIYNASILMPTTDSLMAWADNQLLIFENEYPRYLMSKDPDEMIVSLLAVLTRKNVILYIPQDEFNIYGMILLNHLYYLYGITCNFINTRFSIADNKIPFIISKFYMMNIMSFDEYINTYPINVPYPDFIIAKFMQDGCYNYAMQRKQLGISPKNMVKSVEGDKK